MFKITSVKRADKNHIELKVFFLKFKFKPHKKKGNPLIIFGPLGIGDYMCYRPYFKYIRKSPLYKNSYIVYVSRDIYADFVKNYDSEFFNEIITVNVNSFMNDSTYKKNFIRVINSFKPEKIYSLIPFHPVYGGNLFPYVLFPLIKSKQKYVGYLCNKNEYSDKIDDFKKIFNKRIFRKTEEEVFETERIRQEFEQFFEVQIPRQENEELFIPFEVKKKNIAISLMASSKERLYASEKWVNIINYLTKKIDDDTKIIFLGAKRDDFQIQNIINKLNSPEKCINAAGKLIISMIPPVLKSCRFLISVESGNIHIAHTVKLPAICLSGSKYYGRFHPYEDNIIKYIYPERFNKYINEMNTTFPPPTRKKCVPLA